jgi:hypothetical protein
LVGGATATMERDAIETQILTRKTAQRDSRG